MTTTDNKKASLQIDKDGAIIGIGTARKRCKIYAGDFIGGYFTIYFYCNVSHFRYDMRNIDKAEALK